MLGQALFSKEMVFIKPTISPTLARVQGISVNLVKRIKGNFLFGLILVIGAILIAFYSQAWGRWNFFAPAWTVLKGGFFWFVVMIGLLFLMLGISDLKE